MSTHLLMKKNRVPIDSIFVNYPKLEFLFTQKSLLEIFFIYSYLQSENLVTKDMFPEIEENKIKLENLIQSGVINLDISEIEL